MRLIRINDHVALTVWKGPVQIDRVLWGYSFKQNGDEILGGRIYAQTSEQVIEIAKMKLYLWALRLCNSFDNKIANTEVGALKKGDTFYDGRNGFCIRGEDDGNSVDCLSWKHDDDISLSVDDLVVPLPMDGAG